MSAQYDAGSYRDRRGHVFSQQGRTFRTVTDFGLDDFNFVRQTKLLDVLVANGSVIAEERVDASTPLPDGAVLVLQHPTLPYVSYPYEWPFAALKAAALLHLDVHLAALEHRVTMSDASAYNIQFRGARPVFIDVLSFVPYVEGEFWSGHQQFCNQFLNPLLLRSHLGVPHNAWYRGALEGVATEDLNQLLPWYKKLSWNMLTHVALQARFQQGARRSDAAVEKAKARNLPLIGYQEILRGLRRWIAKLEPLGGGSTDWEDYANQNSYDSAEEASKRDYVRQFVANTMPSLLCDLGCNTGEYSVLALQSGADTAIGFDFDQNAIETAFRRAQRENLNFLPLLLDVANPSPMQGWQQKERRGFSERAASQALLALALVHHLVIGKNIPMQQAVGWLVAQAATGVIEFVQKTDPMVIALLQLREDVFDDYSQESFENALQKYARIVHSKQVSANGRRLYTYERM